MKRTKIVWCLQAMSKKGSKLAMLRSERSICALRSILIPSVYSSQIDTIRRQIKVSRKKTGTPMFDTLFRKLIYRDFCHLLTEIYIGSSVVPCYLTTWNLSRPRHPATTCWMINIAGRLFPPGDQQEACPLRNLQTANMHRKGPFCYCWCGSNGHLLYSQTEGWFFVFGRMQTN